MTREDEALQGAYEMGSLLKGIRAEGLHRRLSFDVSFYDDVNILYGRNGSGKATLLHILANVLNGSFERFAFLEFERITVDFEGEKQLTIVRRHREAPESAVLEFFVNGTMLTDFPAHVVTSAH